MAPCELKRVSANSDRISQLSDDILVEILSLLELKEAGRSSTLSSRWKDLWKSSTCLNFDDLSTLLEVEKAWEDEKKILGDEISRYVRWVNEVLRRHNGTNIEEFIINFVLDASHSKDIDEWIKFIVTKRVKILEIDLSSYHTDDYYCLPDQCFLDLKNPSNLSSLDFLTSLSLTCVNITDEQLEYMSKLPHLEKLFVSSSNHLFNLKVVGSDVQLKHLKISLGNLKSIQLCAPKLVSFDYCGNKVKKIHIGNNTHLSELILMGTCKGPVGYVLAPYSALLPQLETLQLSMHLTQNRKIPRAVELRNLKLLKMEILGGRDESPIGLTSLLIASAPCLRKITLKLFWFEPAMHRLPFEPVIHPHKCLKEVEICGFVGCRGDFELIAYLWKNALNLEKMVIKPNYACTRSRIITEESVKERQERVEELRKSVPAGLTLNISEFNHRLHYYIL